MANIGATTAFYKVETSLTRANNEVSKSMERLATGKQNANAGDRSSYVAMSDTFRLDYVGTKAGIKGASVVMGYLETGMRTLDAASALLSRLQELAVLAANDTNTNADLKAIDAEAEAIGDEFHRLLSTAKYKGKDLFVTTAGSEYVSLGGRDAEMTFGIQKIAYNNLYLHDYDLYGSENSAAIAAVTGDDGSALVPTTTADIKEYLRTDTIVEGAAYEVQKVSDAVSADGTTATGDGTTTGDEDDEFLSFGATDLNSAADQDSVVAGNTFVATASGTLSNKGTSTNYNWVVKQENQLLYAASEGIRQNASTHGSSTAAVDTNMLTAQIEAVQTKINTARVQAGSQYAALESAVSYTTDLTAQYELGYNTVNDVNFSMETAHLAKNQILQQAATAMLAQANTGQQSLLQLIQG
jgi:flagellin